MLLNEMTEIATKSRLNIEHVPGNVVVITGEELKRLGYTTIKHKRFDMLTGVGGPLTMRGVGGTFGFSKVLLQINGVDINNQLFSSTHMSQHFFGALSVDQIDRIEIIRGPGSSIYGGFALSGVINVITKQEPHVISTGTEFLGDGNFRTSQSIAHSYKSGDYTASILANLQQDDGYNTVVQQDSLHALGLGDYSYAPGKPELFQESKTFLFQYQDTKNRVMMEYDSLNHGEEYGAMTSGLLPPNDGRSNTTYERMIMDWKHTESLGEYGELMLGGKYHFYDDDNRYLSYYPPVPEIFPYGVFLDGRFQEQDYSVQTEWRHAWNQHRLLVGAVYTLVDLENIPFRSNLDPTAPESEYSTLNTPYLESFVGDKNFMREEVDREIASIYAQDEWSISDSLMLTIGARYDSYDDIGEALSPRAALVWEINDQHIWKMQYANAYRPPTFYDIYTQNSAFWTNPNLKPEKAHTFEATHIYKSGSFHLSNTLLHIKIKDIINFDKEALQNGNIDSGRVYGWECEALYRWPNIELKGNLSFYETKNNATDRSFIHNPHLMGNIQTSFSLPHQSFLTLWYHYSGKQKRDEEDTRGDYPDKHYINASLQFPIKPADVTLFASDLLDEKSGFPSVLEDYPEDTYTGGRVIGLQLSYKF